MPALWMAGLLHSAYWMHSERDIGCPINEKVKILKIKQIREVVMVFLFIFLYRIQKNFF
jgi:hypothetical protein